jgi:RNA polymerase sigma-32 factor
VEATEAELCARIGRRIGMAADEVARSIRLISGGSVSLHTQVTQDGSTRSLEDTLPTETATPEEDVILRLDHAKARKRIMSLTQEILGEREREVFLARCMADVDDVAHHETLAKRFGVTRERICQLEASAKRKISTALAQEGYADFVRDGRILLPQSRARRRNMPRAADTEVTAAAG